MSIFKEQQRPTLPLWMKWASNPPFEPHVPMWPPEDVGKGWTRQRFSTYHKPPEAPGNENIKPRIYYLYTNEDLHPNMKFWAHYGVSGTRMALGAGVATAIIGTVWYIRRR